VPFDLPAGYGHAFGRQIQLQLLHAIEIRRNLGPSHLQYTVCAHLDTCVSVSLADAADIRATLRMSNMQAQFTSSDSEVHPCLAECTTHLINHLINYSLSGLPLHGGK